MFRLNQLTKLLIIILLSVQLSSCGTILYPERRGQDAGRVDVGVALLDGFWLFVGLIPGLIAFAVDFSTGAIYIPDTDLGKLDYDNIRTIHFDPETTTKEDVAAIISRETGRDVSFSDERLQITSVENAEQIPEFFEEIR